MNWGVEVCGEIQWVWATEQEAIDDRLFMLGEKDSKTQFARKIAEPWEVRVVETDLPINSGPETNITN